MQNKTVGINEPHEKIEFISIGPFCSFGVMIKNAEVNPFPIQIHELFVLRSVGKGLKIYKGLKYY